MNRDSTCEDSDTGARWLYGFTTADAPKRLAERPYKEKGPTKRRRTLSKYSRQRPTLPQSRLCSTIGGRGLNFRVRNGNGCDPSPVTTGKGTPIRRTELGTPPRESPTPDRAGDPRSGECQCQRTRDGHSVLCPYALATEYPANEELTDHACGVCTFPRVKGRNYGQAARAISTS